MCACICVRTRFHTCMCMFTLTHMLVDVHTNTHICVCTHTYTHPHRMLKQPLAYVYRTCVNLSVRVCICVCEYISGTHVCTVYIYIYIYIYIYMCILYLYVYTHNNASSPYARTSRRFPKSCCASPAIFFVTRLFQGFRVRCHSYTAVVWWGGVEGGKF